MKPNENVPMITFVIGFILGPTAEIYFVKSLESYGTLGIFFTRSWIAVFLWLLILASVVGSVMMSRINRHQDAATDAPA